ncbi:DUF1441 family protein [Carnimonas bestiolae]|uniref:DUF1441 family protein n=1 Tax=Carnimonas bestiolae TaxID=3402172 RepID=UPI003EDCA184
MADISHVADAYCWSISRIAQAFGMDRRTVSNRIRDGGIPPAGKKGGHPTYALKDIGAVLFDSAPAFDGENGLQELLQVPQERKAWYQAENERVKLEKELRQLVPADEVAREMSALAKALAAGLDTLPDLLERDAGIPPEALDQVQSVIDGLREQMYQEIMGDDDDGE